MCVIIQLLPDRNIPLDMLSNAVANNWHGYGLMIKRDGKLEIIRKIPKDIDNPDTTRGIKEELDDILRDNDKFERILHLRHQTVGSVTLDNCHPFTVFKDENAEVVFAHNGTLYEYRPADSKIADGISVKINDTRSDSRVFAEEILTPLFNFAKDGKYTDPFFLKTVMKYWSGVSNRGILVSNNQQTIFLNSSEWKNITVKDDKKEYTIKVSNDDYFQKVTRGPIHEENKKKEEAARIKSNITTNPNPVSISSKIWGITKLKDIDLQSHSPLTAELVDIMEDIDLYTDVGTANLANLRADELEGLVNAKPEAAVSLLVHVTGSFKRLHEDYLKLEDKHEKASKMIALLKGGATE